MKVEWLWQWIMYYNPAKILFLLPLFNNNIISSGEGDFHISNSIMVSLEGSKTASYKVKVKLFALCKA